MIGGMTAADAVAILILLTIIIAIGVYLLHWLYRRSSKDQSFVRTGLGGEKVVMGGGAFVVPIVHDITVVNMNAIPMEVRRSGEKSLITKNKMRIDVTAEFFVRVMPTLEHVGTAARTLGSRTTNPEELEQLIQGRFVDAMSAATSTMTMDEIHTGRIEFMKMVGELVANTLGANGLELENASLTHLNQTDISVFDPSNAFDAEGLTQLTEQIEEKRKQRNKIENETLISIKKKDYETEKQALEIDRDSEYARIDQSREVEIRKTLQLAEIEEEKSNSAISISKSRITAEREAEKQQIEKQKLIEAERIHTDKEIRNLEIEKQKEIELQETEASKEIETQRIVNKQNVDAERIENETQLKQLEIESRQAVSVNDSQAVAKVDAAKIESQKRVEAARIATEAEIEKLAIEKSKETRLSDEDAKEAVEKAGIAVRRSVDLERIAKDDEVEQLEIAKNQKVAVARTNADRLVEDTVVTNTRELDELRIAARKYIERFEIEQQKEIEIVDKERLIAVINKSIEEGRCPNQGRRSLEGRNGASRTDRDRQAEGNRRTHEIGGTDRHVVQVGAGRDAGGFTGDGGKGSGRATRRR